MSNTPEYDPWTMLWEHWEKCAEQERADPGFWIHEAGDLWPSKPRAWWPVKSWPLPVREMSPDTAIDDDIPANPGDGADHHGSE